MRVVSVVRLSRGRTLRWAGARGPGALAAAGPAPLRPGAPSAAGAPPEPRRPPPPAAAGPGGGPARRLAVSGGGRATVGGPARTAGPPRPAGSGASDDRACPPAGSGASDACSGAGSGAAVRLGLGYVLGVRADEVAALVAAREAG